MSMDLGHCHGCGRQLPFGYVPVVERWRTESWGTSKVQVPEVMYCQDCGKTAAPQKRATLHRPTVPEVSIPEQAKMLYKAVLQAKRPLSPRDAAVAAGLAYAPLIDKILTKLGQKGKLHESEGGWSR